MITDFEAPSDRWSSADAKARFSELLDRAETTGPQTVLRRGRPAVVVVSVAEWERKSRRVGNLAEFFAASPLRGAELSMERDKDGTREIDL